MLLRAHILYAFSSALFILGLTLLAFWPNWLRMFTWGIVLCIAFCDFCDFWDWDSEDWWLGDDEDSSLSSSSCSVSAKDGQSYLSWPFIDISLIPFIKEPLSVSIVISVIRLSFFVRLRRITGLLRLRVLRDLALFVFVIFDEISDVVVEIGRKPLNRSPSPFWAGMKCDILGFFRYCLLTQSFKSCPYSYSVKLLAPILIPASDFREGEICYSFDPGEGEASKNWSSIESAFLINYFLSCSSILPLSNFHCCMILRLSSFDSPNYSWDFTTFARFLYNFLSSGCPSTSLMPYVKA